MKRYQKGDQISDYQVESWLASGGMGDIYIVQHQSLERREAMKMLKPELAKNEAFITRFLAEARRAAALDHPNIIPIFHISRPEQEPIFFTMKLIEGQTLKAILEVQGEINELQAAQFALQISEALVYAHKKGIVHRDLKPANMILDQNGHLYLLDFGIARAEQELNLTATGTQLGTVAYMSPEQSRDSRSVDARSDLYALGVILYEMLTGELPYQGSSPINITLQHLQAAIPDPRNIKTNLSPKMSELIIKLMQKSPEDRFKNAQELATTLRQDFKLNTGPLNIFIEDSSNIPKDRKKIAQGVTVGLLSLLLILGIALLLVEQQHQSEQHIKLESERFKLEQNKLQLEQNKFKQMAVQKPIETAIEAREIPAGPYSNCKNFDGLITGWFDNENKSYPIEMSVCLYEEISQGSTVIYWENRTVDSVLHGSSKGNQIELREPEKKGNGIFNGTWNPQDQSWSGSYNYYNYGKYSGKSYSWQVYPHESGHIEAPSPIRQTSPEGIYTVQVASRENYQAAVELSQSIPDSTVRSRIVAGKRWYSIVSGSFNQRDKADQHKAWLINNYGDVGETDDVRKSFVKKLSAYDK